MSGGVVVYFVADVAKVRRPAAAGESQNPERKRGHFLVLLIVFRCININKQLVAAGLGLMYRMRYISETQVQL